MKNAIQRISEDEMKTIKGSGLNDTGVLAFFNGVILNGGVVVVNLPPPTPDYSKHH